MEAITKTRGTKNVSSPVEMPLYNADLETATFGELVTMEPVNIAKIGNDKNGMDIRSRLDLGIRLTDIQGCKVGMLVMIGDKTYRNIVTVKGMTNSGVIVEFPDEPEEYYTIQKSIVRFVKNYKEGE